MTPRRFNIAPYLLIVAITAVVYGRGIGFDFVRWDDQSLVSENPLLQPPSAEHLRQFWVRPYAQLYTPLSYTVWSAVAVLAEEKENPAAGLSPYPFHALNLLLHVLCAALVYSILLVLLEKSWPATAGALLFALHPMQVEAVAWISGMNNVLAGAMSLLSIRLYLNYAIALRAIGMGLSSPKSHATSAAPQIYYLLATLAFVLAMLAKPTAIVVPLMAAILDIGVIGRRVRQVAPAIAVWILLCIPEIIITRSAQPASANAMALWQRMLIAMDALAFYAGKIILPFHLTFDYGRSPVRLWQSREFQFTAPAVAIAALLFWRWRGRAGWLVPAALLFVAALLPTMGIVAADFQKYSTVADRYVYLAMLGPALAFGWIATLWPGRIFRAMTLAILSGLIIVTTLQIGHWKDSAALVGHALDIDPGSAAANGILAAECAHVGKPRDAISYYKIALQRNPTDADLHLNLANAYLTDNDLFSAEAEYLNAIALLSPDLRPRALNNLGITYIKAGRRELAKQQFMEALRIDPNYTRAQQNLERFFPASGSEPATR